MTSHTFRRTVATLMDQAGLSARAAADQLGHVKVSMTQDHYYGRRVASTGAARVLEAIDNPGQIRADEDEDAGQDVPGEDQDDGHDGHETHG